MRLGDSGVVVAVLALVAVVSSVAGGRPKWTDRASCNNGTFNDNFHKCYYFFDEEATWRSAAWCGQETDAHLVVIQNAFEAALVLERAKELAFEDDFWIGLSYCKNEHTWLWPNGRQAVFTNWASGFPLSPGDMPCVVASLKNGKWYNAMCDEEHLFVCDNEANVGSRPQPPDDWIWSGATDAWYRETPGNISWQATEITCQAMDAHLTSIHSAEENDFLSGLFSNVDSHWIGLYQKDNVPYYYAWTDGTEVDFVDWKGGAECANCATMSAADGKWHCSQCSGHSRGICKWSAQSKCG